MTGPGSSGGAQTQIERPGAGGCPAGSLKILVDGRVIQDRYHGIGRYTFELLMELSRYPVRLVVLYTPGQGRLNLGPLMACANVHAVASRAPVVSARSQWLLSYAALVHRPDVIFVPYHLSTPVVRWRIPAVTIIHDCIFERRAAASGRSLFSVVYGAVTRLALRSATAVATPSEASRNDIRRFYGADLPPDSVLPHGVGPQFRLLGRPRPRDTDLPSRYILHVGARRPHKNQRLIVEALAKLRASHPDLGLVLVGQQDPQFPDDLGEQIAKLGLAAHVREYTQADDETLLDLYANADVFAYPSQVEGFGMPILEAMAAGIAVVASDSPAVQEAASGAALIVDALTADQWVQALDRVLSEPDLAQSLCSRGQELVARRTWARSAEQTLGFLAAAAARGSKRGRRG